MLMFLVYGVAISFCGKKSACRRLKKDSTGLDLLSVVAQVSGNKKCRPYGEKEKEVFNLFFFVFLFQPISYCTYSHLKRVNIRDGRTWHSDTTIEDAVGFLSSHHAVASYGVVADGPPKYQLLLSQMVYSSN